MDTELEKGILGACIAMGAIFGVGLGVFVGHIEWLGGAGGAIGFLSAFPAIRRFRKSVRKGRSARR